MTTRPNGLQPFRNGLIHQAGRKRRTSDELPPFIGDYVPFLDPASAQDSVSNSNRTGAQIWEQFGRPLLLSGIQLLRGLMSWRPRELLGIPLVFIFLWGFVLWWGEEAVFRRKVQDCAWNRWESWVCPFQCCQSTLG